MKLLSGQLFDSLREQFFGNCESHTVCGRWSAALTCLNSTDLVNHLWADKEFREAYYDAGKIRDLFFQNAGEKSLKIYDLDKIIEKIADQVEYENSASCWQKMLDAALIISKDTKVQEHHDFGSGEFISLVSDFKVIAALTKAMSQVSEIQAHLGSEIKNVAAGESKKQIRKAA